MLGDMNDLYFVHYEAMLNLIEGNAPNAVLATSEQFTVPTDISTSRF